MTDLEELIEFYDHIPKTFIKSLDEEDLKKQKKFAEQAGMPLEDYLIATFLYAGEMLRNEIDPAKKWGAKHLDDPEYREHLKEILKKYYEIRAKVQQKKEPEET